MNTDLSARVLLDWHNVEVFAVRPSERTCYYVSVDTFGWRPFHGHEFLLTPAPPVFTYYNSLAYDSRYRFFL